MNKYNFIAVLHNGHAHQIRFMSSEETLKVNTIRVFAAFKRWLKNHKMPIDNVDWICKEVFEDVSPLYTLTYENGEVHF